MKKIIVFTSARSEYGLMKNVIRKLDEVFDVFLLVGGEHFSSKKGYTINEILEDSIIPSNKIVKVDFFIEGNTPQILSQMVSKGQYLISQLFKKNKYDGIVLMGDRYELFSVTIPAMLYGIPIFHINGGEITEGAIDDNIRHATTKLSHLHLVANEIYAENVSRMGEEDWRIVITGECGLDNIHNTDYASKKEIFTNFGIDLRKRSLLITYHPSTLEYKVDVRNQIERILKALRFFGSYQLIFTAPGADIGSEIIIDQIESFCEEHSNAYYIPHLGSRNYLAVMKNVKAVIGNSSSGLIEAASFNKSVVNIGNRQKNRLSAESVLHVGYDINHIVYAVEKAISDDFQSVANASKNPYDPYQDGHNSQRIVFAVKNFFDKYSYEEQIVKKFDQNMKTWNKLLVGFKC